MLTATIQKALNDQIQKELYSSYLYLSMSAFCHTLHLPGFAHWMKVQAEEEKTHVTKLFDHIVERGETVELAAIQAPPKTFKSVLDIFTKSLEHERGVTKQIHKLYELAGKEKDYATQIMLQWFITEQVEEEANLIGIIERLKMIPPTGGSILYLDKELGKRGQ